MVTGSRARRLQWVFECLYARNGPQHWWPAQTPFEVMVGAVLTQNTAWINVEKAIFNLKQAGSLSAPAIVESDFDLLAGWLKPSGYFNIKARRLRNFCQWYLQQGGYEVLNSWDTHTLRHGLLSVNGVGAETADDMLLYAFERPVFVIDAYTRRLFSRLGMVSGDEGYEHLRAMFEAELPVDVGLFNEYHAQIVIHAKDYCKTKPLCEHCPLVSGCVNA